MITHQPGMVHYRAFAPTANLFPGAHLSHRQGQGFMHKAHDTLIRAQNQKRIDIQATLRNPLGDIMVRVYNQKSSIPIHVIADLSASMANPDGAEKLKTIVATVQSIGYSASQYGDKFAFIGYNDCIDMSLLMPLSKDLSFIADFPERITLAHLKGTATGLLQAHQYLSRQHGLVFWISDFLLPVKLLDLGLQSLSTHTIIPIVIGRTCNLVGIGKGGMISLRDSETGVCRKMLLRNSMLQRYQQNCEQYYSLLEKTFMRHGVRPMFLDKGFDADQASRYFFP